MLGLRDTQNRRENVPPEQEAEIESIFVRGVVSACVDASVPVTITNADAATWVEWPDENRHEPEREYVRQHYVQDEPAQPFLYF
jgi:hypothetical protein